jgi:glycosyltransferase involved in cell wall biosynthesis
MAAAYLAAHVTVVASTEPEAFGRTAIEAAAMACPVIATSIGAPPETVLTGADSLTGWLVRPGDAEALASRLTEALSLAPSARAVLGERARRHALSHFSVDSMQRSTLGVYDRLLATDLQASFGANAPIPVL